MNNSISQYGRLFSKYLKPQWGQLVVLELLLFATLAAQLVNPQVVRHFIDTAQASSPLQVLLGAAMLFIGIAVVEQVCGILTTYFSESVAWTATNRLREDLARHCLKLDMSFHKQHQPGEMIERIDGDVNALANFFSQLATVLLGHLLLLIGVVAILWLEEWRIGLAMTLLICVALGALNWLRAVSVPHWQAVRQTSAELFGSLEEWLNGAEEIRANNAIAYVIGRLHQTLRRQFEKEYRGQWFQVLTRWLSLVSFGIAAIIVYVLGSSLFYEQRMSIGTVYLVVYYLGLLSGPLWQLANEIADLQKAGASIDRVSELFRYASRVQDGSHAATWRGPVSVEFDNVSFHYETDEGAVLRNVSFQLGPGRVLGVLGRTGSGKTTLARLLFRLYDPTSGMIRMGDGHSSPLDIGQVRLAALRSWIGMVTQEVQLFHATVRDNVTLFDDTIPDQRILQSIQELNLEPWLASLPQGLDTVIAAGNMLSAGEAQLLAFARILLRNPSLVILDEASSRLDPAAERTISLAIDKLLQNRTGIIIAHRLETIHRTDDILILENGCIQEYGPRLQLMGDSSSRLARLLQMNQEAEGILAREA